jgi:predicted RNase H-like nuclease/ppGpp synthetase/RelA/SpoT-type nucleotidyltranferase
VHADHYLGIDLAWGPKGATGVAVIDADARLLHVSTRRSDEEIDEALAPYVGGSCLVAIDAPVIVRNPTGSRPAEKALSKDFRRFEAATHPSNTGKPEFADGGRAWHLARRHGLDVNPRSGRARRAIEVYPHPATIVLFGLGRTLKYKHKQGRDLELLRSELLELMRHVESVVTTEDTWEALRRQVEQATRKSELRVVEDQVDAVVCAYVGLFADRWPERTTTYGDLETGYIVTPALPDESAVIGRAVQEYAAGHADLVAAGEQALALATAVLDEAGINYLSVTGRTKTVSSFAEKAGRVTDGKPLYTDPLREITDQIGIRIITYVQSDVDAVAELLADQVVVKDDRDMGRETASEGRFGYASRHLLVALDAARESQPAYALLRGRLVQVQVRTVLQHAWAEFEHDIRYKGQMPAEHARDFDRRFTLAAGLLELADREFSTIRDRLREAARPATALDDADPRLDPRELAAFLAGQYADAGWSRTDHYAWISGLLLELGITSLDELGEAIRSTASLGLNERMDYRYPPGAVRRLDDALLAAFGEEYVELHGNVHRAALLRQRLEKVRG